MKLSANTVLHRVRPEGGRFTIAESVRALGNAGFDAVEVNLAEAIEPDSFFQRDGWRDGVREIAGAAGETGIRIMQTHLPFYNFATPGHENLEMKARMFSRTLEASAMLGARWAVFHAGNAPDAVLSRKTSLERTLDYLLPFLEQARGLGVGIAVENLFIPEYLHSTHRYCSNVEDVCELVDTLGEGAGVCWDFGHANLVGDDQRECLRVIGKRLKAVHVHDNGGRHDDHAVPFAPGGTVPWQDLLPVLHEIGYEGSFNFEVTGGRLPTPMREGFLSYMQQLGRYMISLAQTQ